MTLVTSSAYAQVAEIIERSKRLDSLLEEYYSLANAVHSEEGARRLLSSEPFVSNWILEGINREGDLYKNFAEFAMHRSFWHKIIGSSRREYNEAVNEVAQILPSAGMLKVHPWYSPLSREGLTLMLAVTGYVSGFLMNALMDGNIAEAANNAFRGAELGLAMGLLLYRAEPTRRMALNEIKKEADVLEEYVLPRKTSLGE
jgi:hypothetical protein